MRHLSVARGLLCLLGGALLCSCATFRPDFEVQEEASVDHFLDSEAPSLVCDETRVVGATSFSPTCLPAEGPTRLMVTGLEPLSEPLRACVLTSLPVETGSTAPLACQQGAAQILQGRLRQLGWLDATVSAQEAPAGASAAHLHVQLGGRYQVGPLTVENEGWKVAPHRILTKARAAAPEGSWYTSNVLADIHSRVFQMRKFRAVWVVGGEPDPQTHVVPVTIDVWEKASGKPGKPKVSKQSPSRRPDHCPKRGSICLNGRDCTYDHTLGCVICYCRPDARW
jgi:hypothetical protein